MRRKRLWAFWSVLVIVLAVAVVAAGIFALGGFTANGLGVFVIIMLASVLVFYTCAVLAILFGCSRD